MSNMFKNRTPEAAAIQTGIVLAWLTECNLATLEGLQELKSSSNYRIQRQQSICNKAVQQCIELGIEPVGLSGQKCERLSAEIGRAEDGREP